MKTILVFDDRAVMSNLEAEIVNLPNVTITGIFYDSQEALAYVQDHDTELVVLSIDLPTMDGIELGKRMRKVNPDLMLIYTIEDEKKLIEAVRLQAAGYLLKPYSGDSVAYAVESAYLLSRRKPRRICARTFGHFDLFVDNKPIVFKSAKAKELLAFLIDRRGGIVDSEQIISVLWPNRPKDEATQSLCSKVCKTLYEELKRNGIENLMISYRSNRSIDLDLISCDLYEMLDGNEAARKLYYGEYMTGYDWAEYRNYSLSKYV